MPTCRNSQCNAHYTVKHNEADDGYCSFTCWESCNCKEPVENVEVLELSVEEIIKQG